MGLDGVGIGLVEAVLGVLSYSLVVLGEELFGCFLVKCWKGLLLVTGDGVWVGVCVRVFQDVDDALVAAGGGVLSPHLVSFRVGEMINISVD